MPTRIALLLVASFAFSSLVACGAPGPGGPIEDPSPQEPGEGSPGPAAPIETNVNPVPCESDEDCGEDLECLFADPSEDQGVCETDL